MIWKQRKQVNVQLNLKVEADLNMTGQYDVKGTGLSMVKVTGGKHHFKNLELLWKTVSMFWLQGNGPLSVSVKSLLLTGETFVVIKWKHD